MEAEVKGVYGGKRSWEGEDRALLGLDAAFLLSVGPWQPPLEKEVVPLFSEDHLLAAKLKVRFQALPHSTRPSPHT